MKFLINRDNFGRQVVQLKTCLQNKEKKQQQLQKAGKLLSCVKDKIL